MGLLDTTTLELGKHVGQQSLCRAQHVMSVVFAPSNSCTFAHRIFLRKQSQGAFDRASLDARPSDGQAPLILALPPQGDFSL